MKGTAIMTISVVAILCAIPAASAQEVPSWVKKNAGFWADGSIDDETFIQAIKYLVENGIMILPETPASESTGGGIPAWVRNVAGFWADGSIPDADFVRGLQYLIGSGIIVLETGEETVPEPEAAMQDDGAVPADLEAKLAECEEIMRLADKSKCKKMIEAEIMIHMYRQDGERTDVGPISFYWHGVGSEGNTFEVTDSGQAILSIRMLAENTASENVALHCTSPQICAYDISDGQTEFKYASTDFTSGQLILKPGQAREFNMLFGPNIGYGGTQFVYDPEREYVFRISEDWGSASIPLNLG